MVSQLCINFSSMKKKDDTSGKGLTSIVLQPTRVALLFKRKKHNCISVLPFRGNTFVLKCSLYSAFYSMFIVLFPLNLLACWL